VCVVYFGALAEPGVRLVKEENGMAGLRGPEDAIEIFSVSPMYLFTTLERSIL
jgi:hypothetical protein